MVMKNSVDFLKKNKNMKNIRLYANYSGSDKIIVDMSN